MTEFHQWGGVWERTIEWKDGCQKLLTWSPENWLPSSAWWEARPEVPFVAREGRVRPVVRKWDAQGERRDLRPKVEIKHNLRPNLETGLLLWSLHETANGVGLKKMVSLRVPFFWLPNMVSIRLWKHFRSLNLVFSEDGPSQFRNSVSKYNVLKILI